MLGYITMYDSISTYFGREPIIMSVNTVANIEISWKENSAVDDFFFFIL